MMIQDSQDSKGHSGPDTQRCEIEVTPTDDGLLHAPSRPREGWEEQFAALAQAGDDALLGDAVQTSTWAEREWKW